MDSNTESSDQGDLAKQADKVVPFNPFNNKFSQLAGTFQLGRPAVTGVMSTAVALRAGLGQLITQLNLFAFVNRHMQKT